MATRRRPLFRAAGRYRTAGPGDAAEVEAIALVPLAGFPAPAAAGDVVVLAADGHPYAYSGTAWLDLAAGGSAPVAPSRIDGGGATPPAANTPIRFDFGAAQ